MDHRHRHAAARAFLCAAAAQNSVSCFETANGSPFFGDQTDLWTVEQIRRWAVRAQTVLWRLSFVAGAVRLARASSNRFRSPGGADGAVFHPRTVRRMVEQHRRGRRDNRMA